MAGGTGSPTEVDMAAGLMTNLIMDDDNVDLVYRSGALEQIVEYVAPPPVPSASRLTQRVALGMWTTPQGDGIGLHVTQNCGSVVHGATPHL